MSLENLVYALVQIAHNFGAVAVLGAAVVPLWPVPRLSDARAWAGVILAGWATQVASGALFGAVSLYYYGELPDLSPAATAALAVKVLAAGAGLLLSGGFLCRAENWDDARVARRFRLLAALGATALTAAAFLRWFS